MRPGQILMATAGADVQVAPAEQRRGTGTRLLHELAARIGDDEICYGVPFAHLIGFYGQAGFEECALCDGPAFAAAMENAFRAMWGAWRNGCTGVVNFCAPGGGSA
jgi:predicted N-acetyltransferase YhbS